MLKEKKEVGNLKMRADLKANKKREIFHFFQLNSIRLLYDTLQKFTAKKLVKILRETWLKCKAPRLSFTRQYATAGLSAQTQAS